MGHAKWVPDVKASTAVEKAARKALEIHIETIRQALAPALDALSADVEPVHQLRVGVRRATAVLDLFADCLPRRAYRRARRGLRDLRRSAGQARDWDVFLLTLTGEGRRRGGLDFLHAYAQGHRVAAQALLTEAASRFSGQFSRRWETLSRRFEAPTDSDAPRTLAALASRALADQLRELRDATADGATDLEHLHRVRIIGKRLRYSMEIVAGCFGTTFREQLYPRVEQMQEILGVLNDSRVARQRLLELRERLRAVSPAEWRKARPEISYWSQFHQRRLQRQQRQFVQWLRQWELSRAEDEFIAILELGEPGD